MNLSLINPYIRLAMESRIPSGHNIAQRVIYDYELTLAESWYGRLFIRTYYSISPTLVKWFGHTEWFKKMWQSKLDRMVAKLQANGVESTPYEDRNW